MSEEKQIEEMAYEMTQYKETVCKRIEDNKCLLKFHTNALIGCHSCKLAEYLITEKVYRKQSEGEWVEVQREWDFDPFFYIDFTCSVCGSREQNKRKFCPNCGAKMRKEDEGK